MQQLIQASANAATAVWPDPNLIAEQVNNAAMDIVRQAASHVPIPAVAAPAIQNGAGQQGAAAQAQIPAPYRLGRGSRRATRLCNGTQRPSLAVVWVGRAARHRPLQEP